MVLGVLAEDTSMTRRWATFLWIWVGWTALALFLGISSSLAYLSVGNRPRWWLSIRMSLVETYVWALLTPLVMMLAHRFPFTRATLTTSLPLHIAASLIVSFLKLIADQMLRRMLFGFSTYVLVTSLAPNLLFYWGIVAAAHGFAYYRSSKERELRASQLEARLAEARLQVLRMQLHPHFLFNTLHTISELVHEDPETADRMITGLSDLLREVLEAGQHEAVQEVPLRRELDILDRYIEIQQARFGDRLRLEITVEPGLHRALVPHLLLQPLVENAIRHGLSTRADAGRIRIGVRGEAGTLALRIQDDGGGLDGIDSHHQERVGLGNTRARLSALYGDAHRVDIQNASGGGVIVTVIMPLKFTPGEAA
jgi:two-component system, LytTR family, sensor kinase